MADTSTNSTQYTPYTYEPQYPVDLSAGSAETHLTGFQKFKLEFERVYRILNLEFANYQEVTAEIAQEIYEKMTDYFIPLDDKQSIIDSGRDAGYDKVYDALFDSDNKLVYPNGNKLWIE